MNKYSKHCYKIDIFLNGIFDCSTTEAKTIEAAKKWYIKKHPTVNANSLTFLPYYNEQG